MTSAELRAKQVRLNSSLTDHVAIVIEVLIEIAAQLAESNEREGFERSGTWLRATDC